MNQMRSPAKTSTLADIFRTLEIDAEITWIPNFPLTDNQPPDHAPFEFWLTKILQPKILVELGSEPGSSYLSFCQAIDGLRLDCRAFAIYPRADKTLDAGEIRSFHDQRYSAFSSVLATRTEEAFERFAPKSVDLLNIAVLPEGDNVRRMLRTFRDAMSDKAVLLLQSINAESSDPSLARLFIELSRECPNFAFLHGQGLGVIGLGDKLPSPIKSLLDMRDDSQSATHVRSIFKSHGQALAAGQQALKWQNVAQLERSSSENVSGKLTSAEAALRDMDLRMEIERKAFIALRENMLGTASRIQQVELDLHAKSQSLEAAETARAQLEAQLKAHPDPAFLTQLLAEKDAGASQSAAELARLRLEHEETERSHNLLAKEIANLKADIAQKDLERARAEGKFARKVREASQLELNAVRFAEEIARLREELEAVELGRQALDGTIARSQRVLAEKDQAISVLTAHRENLAVALAEARRSALRRTRQRPMGDKLSGIWRKLWWLVTLRSLERFVRQQFKRHNARRKALKLARKQLKQQRAEAFRQELRELWTPFVEQLTEPGNIAPATPSPALRLVAGQDAAHKIISRMPDLSALRHLAPSGPVAVVAHVFYPALWSELSSAISRISESFDLFVSLSCADDGTLRTRILADYPRAHIFDFPNHGRDILPFLSFAGSGVLFKYDLICKVHTKVSPQLENGEAWRRGLLKGVLGTKSSVARIIAAFAADPDLGIVVADGEIYGHSADHWVDNREAILRLGTRIGIEAIPDGAVFPGGSMYWMRPFLLRTLLAIKLGPGDFEPEPIAFDGTTAHVVERFIGMICADAGMSCREFGQLPARAAARSTGSVRLVANYLPQYHPTPENDAWWGTGFTEWTNVTRAAAKFAHHRQPRLPADLGFYDLRVPDTRQAQASLAQQYGIGGFCYYYYWFDGRGQLRLPLDEMLASKSPEFPFMICWANEPWTRNWDGGNREILMPQTYSPGWVRQFASDIAPILRDHRYVRQKGLPMVAIYRVAHIPDAVAAMTELRRELAALKVGPVHISGGWVGFAEDGPLPEDPAALGLDSWFEFPPHLLVASEITDQVKDVSPGFAGKVYSYREATEVSMRDIGNKRLYPRHRTVMAGWDNTSRQPNKGNIFHGATPALFRRWLRAVVLAELQRGTAESRIIFINAWNEWAEGTYLEPDIDFGHGWLEAVASAAGPGLPRISKPRRASRSLQQA